MKVNIGPYKNWIGPYQIAEAIFFFVPKQKDEHGFKHTADWVTNIGEWLAQNKDGRPTRLAKVCEWIESKRKRKVKIKIHDYDTWNADHTLALIAVPLLKKLKEKKNGAGHVDDEDVPEHLRSTSARPKENEWDTDEFWHDRWDWVLDEMIWSMTELANGKEGESKFFDHSESKGVKDLNESISKIKVDKDGLDQYLDRLQNGCVLFGKYFQGLWW